MGKATDEELDVAGRSSEPTQSALVLDLDDPRCTDSALAGGKGANLARSRRQGLRTLPGFVLSTEATSIGTPQEWPDGVAGVVREQWSTLTDQGRIPVVVRSSSQVEDAETSSLAGQFRSVLGVRGWDGFLAAVAEVQDSALRVPDPAPMAVLVQPYLKPRCGGVLFGVDPVTGRSDHVVVEAVSGGPEALVSGRAAAQLVLMTRRGKPLQVNHRSPRRQGRDHAAPSLLNRRQMRRLAAVSRRATAAFGGPQDVEWALDRDGTLWVLQCRPVTATGHEALGQGPVLGPGPLAEMFPEPLRPLEVDLWIDPLRAGVQQAMSATHVIPEARLKRSPVVVVVDGRVAADLELFGYVGRRRLGWRILDPRVTSRRLWAAWRVGWLRTSLPERAAGLLTDVDARLARVPPLTTLDDSDLVELLSAARPLLEQVHRDEVLAGALLPESRRTAAAVALAVLTEARDRDEADDQVLRRAPVVLALAPPSIGPPRALPPTAGGSVLGRPVSDGSLGVREALRLRARWLQELTARACWELGQRWAERGLLPDPAALTVLAGEELQALADGAGLPADFEERRLRANAADASAPLPAEFRLATDHGIVPVVHHGSAERFGVGAGGGRGAGPVCHGTTARPPSPGDVLVTRTLDPSFAPWLPGLGGLVAETGSVLSHLAILAREHGVPTVVAVPDAVHRFPEGSRVTVDGRTGEVSVLATQDDGRREG